jgi:uncharacterized protein YjbI with pentapeptide repeats
MIAPLSSLQRWLLHLFRPWIETLQLLEARKKPRGERGQRFLDRMAAGQKHFSAGPVALRSRDLRGEDLADAFLADADLSDTDLRDIDFAGADLDGAILTHADLRGANLEKANLTNARLLHAHYDAHTRWPQGFDPKRHGAIQDDGS